VPLLSGTDVLNQERTPYSGGSGLLPAGILRPGQVLAAGAACFSLSIILGLFIVLTRSPLIIAVGFAGVVIGFFYTAPPFKLAYMGLGETARLIATPLMVIGAYLVQVPAGLDANAMVIALAVSLPVAFLNTAALYIFEFPDYEADSVVGKKNLVVRLGRKNAVYLFILLSALAYVALLAGILAGILSYFAGIAFVALPLSALASIGLMKNYDAPKKLVRYMKAASDAYILATVALIVTFIL
jgi:1,4-dihydroxy-2-naphthoate octaprenyltransferase